MKKFILLLIIGLLICPISSYADNTTYKILEKEQRRDNEVPVLINDLTDKAGLVDDYIVLDARATVGDGGKLSYKWFEVGGKDKRKPFFLGVTEPCYVLDTSAEAVRYFYCQIISTINDSNGCHTTIIESSVAKVTIKKTNKKPKRKNGVSYKKNYTVEYNKLFELDLSTVFEDPDDDDMIFLYKMDHNNTTTRNLETGNNFAYEPTDLNNVIFEFNAYDRIDYSLDGYRINLTVKAVNITGYESIADVDAGVVGNLNYANADEVIQSLPNKVTILGTNVEVPIVNWEDTDNYRNEIGSYTFTAQLGQLPVGYIDDGTNRVTVEVIVSKYVPKNAENPTIISDLTDQTCEVGDNIILDATATVSDGGVLSYQWYEVMDRDKFNPTALNVTTPTYNVDTSNIKIRYYFCEVTNTNVNASQNLIAVCNSNVSRVKVNKQNSRPKLKSGVSDNVICTITYGNVYTLDLSTIFEDPDGDELDYYYDIIHDGIILQNIKAQRKFTYEPEDLNDVVLIFAAYDGKLSSNDFYTVNLSVKGIEIKGYKPIKDISAGEVNNLIYANANEVIKVLPKTATIVGTNKKVQITGWEDTDNYRNEVGSYTFTAQLGELPLGYVDDEVNQVTVEVVVLEETKVDAEIPTIINDLTDQTCEVGDTVVLDATATVSDGGKLSYKWYVIYNISMIFPPVLLDVTTPTYTVDTSKEGIRHYFCQITNTNNNVSGKTIKVVSTNVVGVTVKQGKINGGSSYIVIPMPPTQKAYTKINRAKPDKNGIINVNINVENNKDGKLIFKLPSNFLKNPKLVQLTILNDKFELMLSNKMFNKKYKTVELVIEPSDISKLKISDEEKGKMKEARFYNIYFIINGKKVEWISKEDISISIKYNINKQENEYNIVAINFDQKNTSHILKSSYYLDGKVNFKTKQLGMFGLMNIKSPFKDINDNWAKESIEALYARGVINGVKLDEFKPERSIKRANFITLLVKCFDLKFKDINSFENESIKSFDDVNPNEYYAKAIAIAKDIGLTNGCGSNKFKPLDPISREDMMVLLQRVMKITGEYPNIKLVKETNLNFSDISDVENYALDSVKLMICNELVRIELDKIRPKENATRADVVYALYHILKSNMK